MSVARNRFTEDMAEVANHASWRRGDSDRYKNGLDPKPFPTSFATRMDAGIEHTFSLASFASCVP